MFEQKLLVGSDGETSLDEEDRGVLSGVEEEIKQGVELYRWWREEGRPGREAEGFELIGKARGYYGAYGFRDRVAIEGGTLPVIGSVQSLCYTQAKALPGQEKQAAQWLSGQIREFALRYFLRLTSHIDAQTYPALGHSPLPAYLEIFSLCVPLGIEESGVAFRQIYYKRKNGSVGKFPRKDRRKIVDLRQIGEVYEWILLRGELFDVRATLNLFGASGPKLVVPLKRWAYVALCAELIADQERPTAECLGAFGPGFILVKAQDPVLDRVRPAFQMLEFRISNTGACRTRQVFVSREPSESLSVSLDPVAWWSRVVANLFRGGQSPIVGDQLGVEFLVQQSLEQLQVVLGSLQIWNEVPDWLDIRTFPKWLADHAAVKENQGDG